MDVSEFQDTIYQYYHCNGRWFPWRETCNPYYILVSELMLQQTQTDRVVEKYLRFIDRFNSPLKLASASFKEVFSYWQGLGYNRRAKWLHEIASILSTTYQGIVPDDRTALQSLPGVGYATACAILAYAYNRPVVFMETNIRRVFLYFFFSSMDQVSDKALFPYIEDSLDKKNPREWYYALTDYGVYLKKNGPNPNRRSKHYMRQAPFHNSDRQVRGRILHLLCEHGRLKKSAVHNTLDFSYPKIEGNLQKLQQEGFICCDGDMVEFSDGI